MSLVWQDPTRWSTETTDGRLYAESREDGWHLFRDGRAAGTFPTKEEAQAAAMAALA